MRTNADDILTNWRRNIAWSIDNYAKMGRSMRAICKEAGIAHSYLSRMKTGTPLTSNGKAMVPSIRTASKISRALGFDLRLAVMSHQDFLRKLTADGGQRLTDSDPMACFRQNLGMILDRDERGLRQIGREIGMAYTYLSRVRTGSLLRQQHEGISPSLVQGQRIAAEYGLQLSDMLLDTKTFARKFPTAGKQRRARHEKKIAAKS